MRYTKKRTQKIQRFTVKSKNRRHRNYASRRVGGTKGANTSLLTFIKKAQKQTPEEKNNYQRFIQEAQNQPSNLQEPPSNLEYGLMRAVEEKREIFERLKIKYNELADAIITIKKRIKSLEPDIAKQGVDKVNDELKLEEKQKRKELDYFKNLWTDVYNKYMKWVKTYDIANTFELDKMPNAYLKQMNEIDEKLQAVTNEDSSSLLEKIQDPDETSFEAHIKEFIGSITTNGKMNSSNLRSMVNLIVAILKRINARTKEKRTIPKVNEKVNDLTDEKRQEIKSYLEEYDKGPKTDDTTFHVLELILLAILSDTVSIINLEKKV